MRINENLNILKHKFLIMIRFIRAHATTLRQERN